MVACTNKSAKNCESCTLREISETEFQQGGLPDDLEKENPLALVPFQKLDDEPCNSTVVGNSKQTKPRWSLIRQVFQPKKHTSKNSQKNSFVFQRALRQSNCHSSAVVYPDHKQVNIDQIEESTLDGESGAIVPFRSATILLPPTLCSDVSSLPEELFDLRDKYSSSCRLYSLQELASATGIFSPGKFSSLQLMFPNCYYSYLLEISSDWFLKLYFQIIWLEKVVVVMFIEDVFKMARNWL